MSRWFRVYDDLVDDPKVQRLSAETFRHLVNLWCLASKGGGILPPHAEIAFKLRISEQKATKLLDDLRAAGLIEHDETGVYPHNWNGRQYKSDVSTERVKQHRNRKRNGGETFHETEAKRPQRTETETDTEDANASKARKRAEAREEFEQWYSIYPRHIARKSAEKAFYRVRSSDDVDRETLMAGTRAYAKAVAGKEPEFIKHPATWLNGGCWADEHGPPAMNGNAAQPPMTDAEKARVLAELKEKTRRDFASIRTAH